MAINAGKPKIKIFKGMPSPEKLSAPRVFLENVTYI